MFGHEEKLICGSHICGSNICGTYIQPMLKMWVPYLGIQSMLQIFGKQSIFTLNMTVSLVSASYTIGYNTNLAFVTVYIGGYIQITFEHLCRLKEGS